MLELALLLTGAVFVRKCATPLLLIGIIWGSTGALIFIDGLQGIRHFPLHIFGLLLLTESVITLLLAPGAKGAQRALFYFKGGLFCFVALLILSGRHSSNLLLAIILGFAFFITGLFVIASAWVVRYTGWRRALFSGIVQLAFAFFLFLPYPTHHDGTVPQFIGMVMLTGGLHTLRLSIRLRQLRKSFSMYQVLVPEYLVQDGVVDVTSQSKSSEDGNVPLIVHIWTPEGSAESQPVPRPVLNRYIAAVDANGVISTGHSALEMPPFLYISLYPAVEIDRSPSEFFSTLKAVQENNVPGEYQKDYVSEADAWCESDRKIIFHAYNPVALEYFWEKYRQQAIYNLTWRNCSSSVAYALEAALDGVLAQRGNWLGFFSLFLIPELWLAAQLRKRATTMAWTPGLLLDYSRALHALVHPKKKRDPGGEKRVSVNGTDKSA